MSIFNNLDKFLEKKFIGDNKEKAPDKLPENKKKTPAQDKLNEIMNLPDKMHLLEISQKEFYTELHDNILSLRDTVKELKKRIESLEEENENYKDRKNE